MGRKMNDARAGQLAAFRQRFDLGHGRAFAEINGAVKTFFGYAESFRHSAKFIRSLRQRRLMAQIFQAHFPTPENWGEVRGAARDPRFSWRERLPASLLGPSALVLAVRTVQKRIASAWEAPSCARDHARGKRLAAR